MSKTVKNLTALAVLINDTGITIPASGQYVIPEFDYLLWAQSVDFETAVNADKIILYNGLFNLTKAESLLFIKYPDFATNQIFLNDTYRANGFSSRLTQMAIEEARGTFGTPVSIGLDNLPGSANTHSRGDHIHRVDNLTFTSLSPRMVKTTTTLNGTLVLTVGSNYEHAAYGSATGFKYRLPDATTLVKGWKYEIINRSSVPVSIVYDDLTTLYQIASAGYAVVTLEDNSTNDGTWIVIASNLADIDLSNPDFTGVKDGFEDFMFDAYAGNGGNDNQYAFTAIPNGGSSGIDGAVTVVGNDYEGIHILDSLASATSRPMVESFNLVNRIKLGAQPESYEIRARVETLANTSQKFTTRYGLMDIDTIGLPANGIIFSYDPIYPVTPVAQVVTATPIVTSQLATQIFTQTINGTPYTYTYKTFDVDTLTPNSFPVATFQRISITWTRTNNTTYTVVINGVTCSYTSDATATDAEISAGLSAAINANVGAAVTATNAKPVVVTSNVLGQAFTYSGTNVTITLSTANVPREIYSVTIGARPTYNFLSDGTPTAAEVVSGLIALINADALCEMTASGTTVLTLTGKVLGVEVTVTQSANLTFSETTASTTATNVVTQLKTIINANAGVAVVATGTTTLILTAKIAGTAFTYAGTANLTQVLTTANVPEVLYSGNWICTVIKDSTATHINSNIPVVAGQWYRLKAVIRADGTAVYFYIDSLFINELTTAVPTAGLRYIFKLEKTLGTQSRTTSIDYITWRRTRG